jgi:TctA family transporter
VLYVFAQLLGAITACGALYGLLPGPLLLETQRAETVSVTQALFIGESVLLCIYLAIHDTRAN